MKMYTSRDHTAKLIELGFAKPKGWYIDGVTNNIKLYVNIDENPMMFNYSIGELLSFLPTRTYSGSIYIDYNGLWRVGYENTVRHQSEFELIDALYDMCVKLKEEGVI